MTRVIGIDPGTVSTDVCGLVDGHVYLDESRPTRDALEDLESFVNSLSASGWPDLIAGPSGYGLPLMDAASANEADLRVAFLAAPEETGGIGGLRGLARRLSGSGLPVVYTPGVIHLDTVPEHRKINRVDLGTADKVCAAALGIHQEAQRSGVDPSEVSFILLELGGAFTAGVAVEQGQIVDGIGGTSGPIGWRAVGALDGEVAFLAGEVTKSALFNGGVTSLLQKGADRRPVALAAYVEGAVKAVRQLQYAAPSAEQILLSGRMGSDPEVRDRVTHALSGAGSIRPLMGFARIAKQGAQGAALLADGLMNGSSRQLVDRLRIREARGTVLDNLIFISPETARRRLGLSSDA